MYTFKTAEAKEVNILEGVLRDIEYVLKHGKDLGPSGKDVLNVSKNQLKKLIKQKKHDSTRTGQSV